MRDEIDRLLYEIMNKSCDILNKYIKLDSARYGYDVMYDMYYIEVKIRNSYIRMTFKEYELSSTNHAINRIIKDVCYGLINIIEKR